MKKIYKIQSQEGLSHDAIESIRKFIVRHFRKYYFDLSMNNKTLQFNIWCELRSSKVKVFDITNNDFILITEFNL